MSSVVNMSENTLIKLKTTLKNHFESNEKSQGDVQQNQGSVNEHLLSRMVKQLEDRVEEQSKMIKHLIGSENSEITNIPLNKNNENKEKRVRIKSSSNVPQNNTETKMDEPVKINIKEKNVKKTNIEGSAIVDENEFQAAPKKAWLFIGRAQQTTTKEKVENYLAKKNPNTVFEVEEIKKHATNNSKNKSFKAVPLMFLLVKTIKLKMFPTIPSMQMEGSAIPYEYLRSTSIRGSSEMGIVSENVPGKLELLFQIQGVQSIEVPFTQRADSFGDSLENRDMASIGVCP
ncbi:unnamed protein product [Brassicogethes aeneus]|uniref:Uncharacterized protein n=1 Tax=Brassicogethes aeneus TaxID=1431903 RepID=A0A9P0FB37_BRAAE|nr:unnamed protein product [Brassicogethes aeneus]